MPRWLLLDYGQVLCVRPPDDEWSDLVVAAGGMDPERFHAIYWGHRVAYDRGDLTPHQYWDLVAPDGDRAALQRLDVAMWLHPHEDSVAAARRAQQRDWKLALLSNAPHPVADAIDGLDWMQFVGLRFFSCRIGAVKPDAGAYHHVLDALGASPQDVWFLDDRPANVAAAADIGMTAAVYQRPDQIEGLPALRADPGDQG